MFFAAEFLTEAQMAVLIREGSGIVCLCLPEEKVHALGLPMMAEHNTSAFQLHLPSPSRPRAGLPQASLPRTA